MAKKKFKLKFAYDAPVTLAFALIAIVLFLLDTFAFKGKLMPELVQALRSIGKDNITPEIENRISQLFLKAPETDTIEHDLLLAPVWMRQLIKKQFTTIQLMNCVELQQKTAFLG